MIYYSLVFVSYDKKLMNRIQIQVNDMIQSSIWVPSGLMNSIILVEVDVALAAITRRYMECRGYETQLNLCIKKHLLWFGSFGNQWKDDG